MDRNNTSCCFTLSNGLWWLLTLLGLATLFYLMMNAKQAPIENDIEFRTNKALETEGLNWVKPSLINRGRDVLLSGVAPSEAARQQALDVAKTVQGSRSIDHNMTIADTAQIPVQTNEAAPALESASLNLEQSGDKVTLSGSLPSQKAIDSVLAEAQQAYGETNITNQLQLSDKVGEPSWLTTILRLIPSLPKLDNHSLKADDSKLSISGDARDNETYQAFTGMIDSASKESGLTANPQIKIPEVEEPPLPTPTEETSPATELVTKMPEPSAPDAEKAVVPEVVEAKNTCQEQLNSALAESTILFDTNSANIRSESFPLLQQLGSVINECKEVIRAQGIEIAGHTDSRGNDAYNLKLSQRRADSVMNYLKQNQVDSSLMHAKGYGETQPIASEDTDEGLAKNRRITFIIQ